MPSLKKDLRDFYELVCDEFPIKYVKVCGCEKNSGILSILLYGFLCLNPVNKDLIWANFHMLYRNFVAHHFMGVLSLPCAIFRPALTVLPNKQCISLL